MQIQDPKMKDGPSENMILESIKFLIVFSPKALYLAHKLLVSDDRQHVTRLPKIMLGELLRKLNSVVNAKIAI